MWPNLQFPADLIIFIEEILNGKLQFLSTDILKQIPTSTEKPMPIFLSNELYLMNQLKCQAYNQNKRYLNEKYKIAVYKVDNALKSNSQLPKKFLFICFNESPLKMMKNVFLFYLKNYFCSQDI